MQDRWEQIRLELALAARNEYHVHPHVVEERPQYFHCADDGSTEYEYLNLLHALVLATKPRLVLETGTYRGYGTIALATALEANALGELISVDIERCDEARALCDRYGLKVSFIQAEAVKWCGTYHGPPFDFVFHDSGGHRPMEHEAMKRARSVAPGAIVVFHDTSRYRCGPTPNKSMVSYLAGQSFPKGIAIHLSRGLTFAQCD